MSKLEKKIEKSHLQIYLFFKPFVARGFGHIGVIIKKDDICYKFEQGAIHPNGSVFRLLLWKQKAVVDKRKRRIKRNIHYTFDKYSIVKIKNVKIENIEERIEEYINIDRPYNSIFNNCVTFIWFILNSEELKLRKGVFPKSYFRYIKKKMK